MGLRINSDYLPKQLNFLISMMMKQYVLCEVREKLLNIIWMNSALPTELVPNFHDAVRPSFAALSMLNQISL
jgi:hypothetical protein